MGRLSARPGGGATPDRWRMVSTNNRADIAKRDRDAGLDGLRAIAVGYVILFHYWTGYMPGGFVGVDVFFVLSGFLITGLLLRELDRTDTINFKAFYLRRALRLMPAMWVVIACLFALLLIAPIYSKDLFGQDAIWVLTFMSNWKRAFIERFGGSLFFNHTWSLGVEQQFYLTWPLLLAALSSRLSRCTLFATIVALIAAVTMWRWYLVWSGASVYRTFHGFDTRIDQILAGCALAVAMSIPHWRIKFLDMLNAVPFCAAPLVFVLPFIGLICPTDSAALPVIGSSLVALAATIIIADCHLRPSELLSSVLSLGPLAFLGSISYGLYLWHIPVLAAFVAAGFEYSLKWKMVALCMTLLLATGSFYLVERRFLRIQVRPSPQARKSFPGELNPNSSPHPV
jgi:peptidoglycan/LPS O-acetylase OafA/YrhL